MYRQDLQVFRESALPRQFARSFNEDPETNIIHAKLGDISKRFEQLKAQGTEQTNLLREVVEKQQRYGDLVDDMNNWLHDAESSLKNMQRDPVGTDPVTVRRQIDALKVRR